MTWAEFWAAAKAALSNLLPPTQPERAVMIAGGVFGALLGFIAGAFDETMFALIALSALDFFTGWSASGKEGELKSRKGWDGMKRKVFMFCAVFFCYVIDVGMGLRGTLRNTAICGYSANEALSVLENIDRMGYGQYIPDFLRKKIAQLRDEKAGRDK